MSENMTFLEIASGEKIIVKILFLASAMYKPEPNV